MKNDKKIQQGGLCLHSQIVGQYLKLPTTWHIADFIDYIWFYYNSSLFLDFLNTYSISDNDNKMIWDNNITIDKNNKKYRMIETSFASINVPVARIENIFVHNKNQTKVSIYGKWLHVIRKKPDLYNSLLSFLYSFGLLDTTSINISRLDFTSDFDSLNYNVDVLLRTSKTTEFKYAGILETIYYWSKKSSVYIRFYNKKLELQEKWYDVLYPEYDTYSEIMRYEIQLKSNWIPLDLKVIKLDELYDIVFRLWRLYNPSRIVPTSTKSKKRAKQIFNWFLNDISSIYTKNDIKHDYNLIFKERYSDEK